MLVLASALLLGLLCSAGTSAIEGSGLTLATHLSSGGGATSGHWSGYVLHGGHGKYTSITGEWQVPAIAASAQVSDLSTWIGIGGDSTADPQLIQIGTEEDATTGAPIDYAWYELVAPKASPPIHLFKVNPGDTISASIEKERSAWVLAIEDITTGEIPSPAITHRSFSGLLTTAEWIDEAPLNHSGVTPLADFGVMTFDELTVDGKSPDLATRERLTMVYKGQQQSTPSRPNRRGDGFEVAWGPATPPPPRPGFSFDELTWRVTHLGDLPAEGDSLGYDSLSTVSCPSSQLCVVSFNPGPRDVDLAHEGMLGILISTAPRRGASTYSEDLIDTGVLDAHCPSTTLCVGEDQGGQIHLSTDPAGGPNAWPMDFQLPSADVVCPSSKRCFAVAGANLYTTSDPAGAWTKTATVTNAPEAEPGFELVYAMSCPTTTLCVAADNSGNMLAFENPASADPTIIVTGDPDGTSTFADLTCSSSKECWAKSESGQFFLSTNPTSAAWTPARATVLDASSEWTSISCPSAGFCVAVDDYGHILTSTDPVGPASEWSMVSIDNSISLNAVSCPNTNFCVAVDSNGDVITGTSAKKRD